MTSDQMKSFRNMSGRVGRNFLYIQGAGGNTSIKLDNGVMLVKASGKWLKDAAEDDTFVAVDWARINQNIAKNHADILADSQIAGQITALRPSIETSLHSLMPHKVVVHTHSVNTIVHAVVHDCKEQIAAKLGDLNWVLIPYCKPGLTLTKLVATALTESSPDVLVIQNHGLVVGAQSAEEAYTRLLLVEERLACEAKFTVMPDATVRQNACDGTDFKFADSDLANQLAFNEDAIHVAMGGSLYPDHVVFLGSGLVSFDSVGEGIAYLSSDNKEPLRCKAAIIRGRGVIHNKALSQNAVEMLKAFAAVAARIPEGANIKYLTRSEELELVNWDAEKYRKSLEKHRNSGQP